MQGDIAPCGTTDRDAAAPHLLPPSGSTFRSPSFGVFRVFRGFFSTCSPFSVCSVYSVVSPPSGSAFRSPFSCISSILWFPPHMQYLKGVFDGGCIILWDVVH